MFPILDQWPTPPGTPFEKLQHTLDAYADSPDEDMVVIATSGVYGKSIRTGLTWGDLRVLAAKYGQD